jgi:dTDP-4-amino-4,6-dideoxygalactose transaminase
METTKVKVPLFRPSFSKADIDAIAEVIYSGHITTGPRCSEFETMFAKCLGVAHAVSVNSCSAALHLALAAADIGPGDIVFVPTLAFASDIQAVQWQGAKPILVDCEPSSLCIDPVKLRKTIEQMEEQKAKYSLKKTYGIFRAVIVVDYGGQMADYSALRKICRD